MLVRLSEMPADWRRQVEAQAAQDAETRRARRRATEAMLAAAARPVPAGRFGGRWAPYHSKTEALYADWLDQLRLAGQLVAWHYSPLKLLLPGKRNTYTPDFLIQPNAGPLELHEVKGFWREDARVKFKTAVGLLGSAFRFVIVRRVRGEWELEYD